MNRLLFLLLISFSQLLSAQENPVSLFQGKVISDWSNLSGIYVINLKTEKATLTDEEGNFSIEGAVGDTLLLSSVQYKSTQWVLKTEHSNGSLFFVKINPIMNELREVIVRRYPNINAEAMGIVPYGQKKYTPAERKLATASSGKLNPMGLDPLLNYFSGRTAMLKKELEVEKKETFLVDLDNMFNQNHYVNILHIPALYIKGFQYFAVENPQFTRVLNTKNRTSIEFLLGELATKYLELQRTK